MPKNLDLFDSAELEAKSRKPKNAPLADKLRPKTWQEFKGLKSLDQNLVALLQAGKGVPPSMILWGPPGSGKTTLARLVGASFKAQFVSFSAVLGGVKEVREIVAEAKRSSAPTILFVDEIHRFNRAQQDGFLPHIEDGTIVLIGATTENPSFYLNAALLSRCKVLVLPPLAEDDLALVLEHGAKQLGLTFSAEASALFCHYVAGDARRLINLLELFAAGAKPGVSQSIEAPQVQEFLRSADTLYYDRSGEEHYNMISAFIKSMRGSDPDAALFWCMRMLESGEDPLFLLRRMIIFASEDISNADPQALPLAVAAYNAFECVGMPEGKIPIAQCVTYLACAPKSNRSYMAMHAAIQAVREHPKVTVPLHLRNAPTKLMRELGYHQGYQYPHDSPEGYAKGVSYLPQELGKAVFYQPSNHGAEALIAERLMRDFPRSK